MDDHGLCVCADRQGGAVMVMLVMGLCLVCAWRCVCMGSRVGALLKV